MKKQTAIEIFIWAVAAFCIYSLYSCGGTRQTATEKKEEAVIQNNYSEGSKIVLGNTFTYTPFDALKPMKIEGKIYENAIVSNDKSKTVFRRKDRYITKTITIEKTKQTEKSDNTILYALIAFFICFFIFLWFYLPKLKG